MPSFSMRMGMFASADGSAITNTWLLSVPTNVHVFRGVPHAFRRFGDKLPAASKYWDKVMSDGIPWALSNPSAGEFEIKSD